jgi:hypothetical protein
LETPKIQATVQLAKFGLITRPAMSRRVFAVRNNLSRVRGHAAPLEKNPD